MWYTLYNKTTELLENVYASSERGLRTYLKFHKQLVWK